MEAWKASSPDHCSEYIIHKRRRVLVNRPPPPVVLIKMTVPSATDRRRKISTSLQRHRKILTRILIASSFVAVIVALACTLPRPSTPVVHAYSSESKTAGATLFHEKGCEHCHCANGRAGG